MAVVSQFRIHSKVIVMDGGTATADTGHAALRAAADPGIPVLHFEQNTSTPGIDSMNVFLSSKQTGSLIHSKIAITDDASPTITN